MSIGICDGLVSPPGGGGGGGSELTVAATWTDLPTTGAEGDGAYLSDAQILVRWSGDIDPLDADGRRWVPQEIYSDATGTGVIAGVVEWLEPIDCASVGDGNPVETWPSRAGTGDYTAAGTARPTFDADGGADGGAAVAFDGSTDYMAKGGANTILTNRTAYSVLALLRPDGVAVTGFAFLASHNGSNFARYALAQNGAGSLIYLDTGGTNSGNISTSAQAMAAATWSQVAHHWSAAGLALVSRGPEEVEVGGGAGIPAGAAGASDYIRIGAWRNGAEPTVTDPFAGRIGSLLILAGTDAPSVGVARSVAAWLSSRAGLL